MTSSRPRAGVEGPPSSEQRGRPALFGLAALILSGAALPLLSPGKAPPALGTWIWLALWAPAAGALASTLAPRWLACLPGLCWAAGLLTGLIPAPDPIPGTLGVLSLYLLGLAGALWLRRPWALAAGLLLGGGALGALPSAGGIWSREPGPGWIVPALNASPVVWVCESAGFDWMRHSSVYEAAGAGDLGPQQRLAWSGMRGPLGALLLGGGSVLLALRRRSPRTEP